MKKLAARRQKPKTKKRRANPPGAFAADLSLLRRLLGDESLEEERLESMVDEFLSASPQDITDFPDDEVTSALAEQLDCVRVDANGGDPEARKTLKSVRNKIDEAAGRDEIHPAALFLLARLFAGAQVDIGDAARASLDRMVLAGFFPQPGGEAFRELVQSLIPDFAHDPFVLHEEVRLAIAAFPLAYRAAIAEALAVGGSASARQSAVGFLLDPAEPVASAAMSGLAASAARGLFDSVSRSRIEMIRPWLSPAARAALASIIPSASPAFRRAAVEFVTSMASVCDGSGAAALFAMLKCGARYSIASVMTKPWGVAECFLVEDLPKGQAEAILRQSSLSAEAVEVSFMAWARLLRLALGRNLARRTPPPFELVRVLEAIGLDSLGADLATPAEIIDSTLTGIVDSEHRDASWKARETFIADSWFEAGEDVDAVLHLTNTVEGGARALLKNYLPGRREFWASQCALSALALKDGKATSDQDWKRLALVGRDLLRDVPLYEIPLMRHIAERSAAAFFLQHERPLGRCP